MPASCTAPETFARVCFIMGIALLTHGIDVYGKMAVIVAQNTNIPLAVTRTYTQLRPTFGVSHA